MADIPDRSRLYAKTSHPHICYPGIRGNVSASRNGAAVLGADPKFNYTDASGKKQSVDVVDHYYPKKIVQPIAKADAQIDPKLRRAATIAEERARAHSLRKCWCFVKEALVAAGVVKSRPQTPLAKQAGQELVNNYGFKKLPVSNPYEAPVGSVLVYGAKSAAGHVEIRTETGFVSDFRSETPSRRPLIGVFAKS